MSDQTNWNGLAIQCTDETKRVLCDRFRLPNHSVASLNDLEEIDSRFSSTQFDFIAVDRDFLMKSNKDMSSNLEKLSALTQSLIVISPEAGWIEMENMEAKHCQWIGSNPVSFNSQPDRETVELIEHESRNVLQRMQMRIELCRSAAAGSQAVLRNLSRIEKESETLGEFIRILRLISQPIKLKLTRHSPKQLIELSWNKLVREMNMETRATLDLKSGQRFRLDVDKFTTAVDSVIQYVFANAEEDSRAQVVDCPVVLSGASFLELSFSVTLAGGVKFNPQFQFAYPQQIIEAHGGNLKFDTSEPTRFTCSVFLPIPAE